MNIYHEFMYLCYINKIKNVDSRIVSHIDINTHCRYGTISDTILLKTHSKKYYKNFIHLQKEPKTSSEVAQLIDEYFI